MQSLYKQQQPKRNLESVWDHNNYTHLVEDIYTCLWDVSPVKVCLIYRSARVRTKSIGRLIRITLKFHYRRKPSLWSESEISAVYFISDVMRIGKQQCRRLIQLLIVIQSNSYWVLFWWISISTNVNNSILSDCCNNLSDLTLHCV